MAVRRPLYWNGSSIVEMTDTAIERVVHRACYQYGLDPSVKLSRKANGNLSGMTDTRLIASGTKTTVGPDYADPDGLGSVSATYDYVHQTIDDIDDTPLVDGSKVLYPVFYNNGNIQAMTKEDFFDTFIYPAIDILSGADTSYLQGGTYTVSTSASATGYTAVSSSLIFYDSRANASKYSSDGIPEAVDQAKGIRAYYLLRRNTQSVNAQLMLHATSSGDVQIYSEDDQDNLLGIATKWTAAESTNGYKIRYSINGTGTTRGTTMKDTRLNSSVVGKREINADDYRSQRFPAGSATTISNYRLKIRKE